MPIQAVCGTAAVYVIAEKWLQTSYSQKRQSQFLLNKAYTDVIAETAHDRQHSQHTIAAAQT